MGGTAEVDRHGLGLGPHIEPDLALHARLFRQPSGIEEDV